MKDLDRQLLAAAAEGNTQKVEQLIQQGADVNAKNESGETALHLACAGEHKETVMALYRLDANTDARNNENKKPIQKARWMGATYKALWKAIENENYYYGL